MEMSNTEDMDNPFLWNFDSLLVMKFNRIYMYFLLLLLPTNIIIIIISISIIIIKGKIKKILKKLIRIT